MDKPKTQRKPIILRSKKDVEKAFNNKIDEVIKSELTNIEKKAVNRINEGITAIVAEAMGLRERFGTWEVKDDDGPLVERIREQASSQIDSTIDEFMKTVESEKIKKRVFASMIRKYNEIYEEVLLEAVEEVAREMAKRDAADFLKRNVEDDGDKNDPF